MNDMTLLYQAIHEVCACLGLSCGIIFGFLVGRAVV